MITALMFVPLTWATRSAGRFANRLALFLTVMLAAGSPAAMAAAAEAPSASAPALRVPGPLSARNASYRMRVKLDEVNHRLSGEATLTWRNLERQPASELVFHVYQNAFKNYASTYIFEVGAQLRGDSMPEHGFGAMDITALKVNGRDLRERASLDDTLLTVPLDTPVGPSATVEVQLTWTVQLPRVFARSGWADSFHAGTQWFPKIGVFDCADSAASSTGAASAQPSCRWRAAQYHGVTEFFADYGVYDVVLDVPAAMVVGATGVLAAEQPGKEGRKLLTYHAEDVHDFAFFADPHFVEVNDRIDDQWGSVSVRLLTRQTQEPYTPRHLAAVRAALLMAEERLGLYPYSAITIIVPPYEGRGSAGMEYPTLFTSIALPFPGGIHALEDTTVHEFMHQYFYGIVGSDEVEEAWLDEGLTQTFTGLVLERMFGERCSELDLPHLCLSSRDLDWAAYRSSTRELPLSTRSYDLPVSLYGNVTYAHTAVMMRTLERYLGPDRMAAALRRYAERFRFRHPRRSDFVATMSEGAGEDLGWFFQQTLDTTRVADYLVLDIENKPHQLAAGLWDCPVPPPPSPSPPPPASGVKGVLAVLSQSQADRRAQADLARESQQAACAQIAKANAADKNKDRDKDKSWPPGRHELLLTDIPSTKSALHDSEVIIQRRGELLFPVDILVVFADGSREQATWTLAEQQAEPETRIKTLRYRRRPSPVARVEVDPEQRLLLDERHINNGRYAESRLKPVLRIFLSIVGGVQTLLDLVGA